MLVLPRTELSLHVRPVHDDLTLTGRWTEELLACMNGHGVFAQVGCARLRRQGKADTNVPQTCLDFYRLGISAERYWVSTISRLTPVTLGSKDGRGTESIPNRSKSVRHPYTIPSSSIGSRRRYAGIGSVDVTVKYRRVPAPWMGPTRLRPMRGQILFRQGARCRHQWRHTGRRRRNPGMAVAAATPTRPLCVEVNTLVCTAIKKDLEDLRKSNETLTTLTIAGQGPNFDKQFELRSKRDRCTAGVVRGDAALESRSEADDLDSRRALPTRLRMRKVLRYRVSAKARMVEHLREALWQRRQARLVQRT